MKTKKLKDINKREVVKVLMGNGYDDMYENDVIIDVLENRTNEVYTLRQVEGVKLFHPNATYKRVDAHTYIFQTIS